ncbi:ficolin-1-like [Physella acuta]|uniref:ficolin-1-like n=1 Tax=Physella acuta TaxID=109671 RepID=UPI0027DE9B6F|nr:ficolin-1-like [Physella acuta]
MAYRCLVWCLIGAMIFLKVFASYCITSDSKHKFGRVEVSCPTSPDTCRDVDSTDPRPVVILSSGLEVMCDTQTDGGGWTVIQRRVDGNTSFYRGWEEYKYGFGNFNGDFYLGNENIHRITSLRSYQLRVDLKFNQASYYAEYSRFRVYGEQEGYRLKLSGFSGNTVDGFLSHYDSKFSTYDRDNDGSADTNCAVLLQGGYWYSHCHVSNLNGLWGSTEQYKGLNWYSLTGVHASVSYSEMKIRPVN